MIVVIDLNRLDVEHLASPLLNGMSKRYLVHMAELHGFQRILAFSRQEKVRRVQRTQEINFEVNQEINFEVNHLQKRSTTKMKLLDITTRALWKMNSNAKLVLLKCYTFCTTGKNN